MHVGGYIIFEVTLESSVATPILLVYHLSTPSGNIHTGLFKEFWNYKLGHGWGGFNSRLSIHAQIVCIMRFSSAKYFS